MTTPDSTKTDEDTQGITLSADEADDILAKIDKFDAELDEKNDSFTRVHFRWGVDQVHIVKKAAVMMGVTYQNYIKHVVMRQAVEDIQRLNTLMK